MKRSLEQIKIDNIKKQEQRQTTGKKCKHEECDKKLTHAEAYFSDYCFKHQRISRQNQNK